MKKIMAVIVAGLVWAGVVKAEEFYRPVYGSFTNLTVTWTNHLGDPVILRNVMVRSGASNMTFSVDTIVNSSYMTNRVVDAVVAGVLTNTASKDLWVILEMGDKVKFNASTTMSGSADPNRYVIYLLKNQ